MRAKIITFLRIIRTGIVNFGRNLWLAIAAMAIMIITLTIILFSLIVNATFNNTIQQITSKIDVSVFLNDSVTPQQAQQLIQELKSLPSVKTVQYLDKQQALQVYEAENAGNTNLVQAIDETNNPIPATIHVTPKNINQIDEIRNFINEPNIAKLQSDPSQDNNEGRAAIDKVAHATNILRKVGIIAVAVFGVISVLIIFNTIQMAIFNRRDELQIMRLLGASTWFIRGPFVVESIVYGILSAIASVLIINGIFVTASSSLQATSFGLLDISYSQSFFETYYWRLLTMQLVLGIFIGAASSVIATRRYLKFKTPKK
jgi:cell division transport system permease protein